ncbi:hypothetical protein [Bacillus swezeyi]|uniref:Uncharacterized protein n=1 Tax=Bacillus swezeyi TaxID=1925020 RepID=A0A5M8RIT3_9BACI|nr:hypothetical protein [Bacillus swezeyi]KAA6446973.1 hypothetical protein DX927_23290 [Bacillus swezeyi]KAA6471541.1 hypothetical protein DX928_23530 [Bacillus swezeyi]
MSPLPKEIFQKWIHSFEEDTQNITVYRPIGYELAPARGRSGLEFKQNGTIVNINPGPSEGSQKVEGEWKTKEKDDEIFISFPTRQDPTQIIEVLECNDEVLKVRKHNPN